MAEFCSCEGSTISCCFSGLCHSFGRQSYAILSPFLSFLLTAWLLPAPQPASLTQPCRPSQLELIARRVHLSQLAFRYLSEACWFRHRCKWFEQVVEIFTLQGSCPWLYKGVPVPQLLSSPISLIVRTLLTNTLKASLRIQPSTGQVLIIHTNCNNHSI